MSQDVNATSEDLLTEEELEIERQANDTQNSPSPNTAAYIEDYNRAWRYVFKLLSSLRSERELHGNTKIERDGLALKVELLMQTHEPGSLAGRILDSGKGFSSGVDLWTCKHCGHVNNAKSINCIRCRK